VVARGQFGIASFQSKDHPKAGIACVDPQRLTWSHPEIAKAVDAGDNTLLRENGIDPMIDGVVIAV
jgi:hypothetical protein